MILNLFIAVFSSLLLYTIFDTIFYMVALPYVDEKARVLKSISNNNYLIAIFSLTLTFLIQL